MEIQARNGRQNRYPSSEILEEDFQRIEESIKIASNGLDAGKRLFLFQVRHLRIFFDSMDDADRDVSLNIFDEPAVKTAYKSVLEQPHPPR